MRAKKLGKNVDEIDPWSHCQSYLYIVFEVQTKVCCFCVLFSPGRFKNQNYWSYSRQNFGDCNLLLNPEVFWNSKDHNSGWRMLPNRLEVEGQDRTNTSKSYLSQNRARKEKEMPTSMALPVASSAVFVSGGFQRLPDWRPTAKNVSANVMLKDNSNVFSPAVTSPLRITVLWSAIFEICTPATRSQKRWRSIRGETFYLLISEGKLP